MQNMKGKKNQIRIMVVPTKKRTNTYIHTATSNFNHKYRVFQWTYTLQLSQTIPASMVPSLKTKRNLQIKAVDYETATKGKRNEWKGKEPKQTI